MRRGIIFAVIVVAIVVGVVGLYKGFIPKPKVPEDPVPVTTPTEYPGLSKKDVDKINVFGFYDVKNIIKHTNKYDQTVTATFDVDPWDFRVPVRIHVDFTAEKWSAFIDDFKFTRSGTIRVRGKYNNRPQKLYAGGQEKWPVSKSIVRFTAPTISGKERVVWGIELFITNSDLVSPEKRTKTEVKNGKAEEDSLDLEELSKSLGS